MVALFGYLSEALRKRPQAPRRVQLQGAHLFGVSNCARADCSGFVLCPQSAVSFYAGRFWK